MKSWYNDWHKTDSHKVIHWLVFILIVVVAWLGLSGQISNWIDLATSQGPTVNLPKAQAVLSLDPQQSSVTVGASFAANIVLDTANGPIDGVDIYALHYDPTILKVIDDVPTQKGTQIDP